MKIKLALAFLLLFMLGSQYKRPAYEYKLLYQASLSGDELRRTLDQLGAEGWELIYVRPRDGYAGGDYIFKRPK